MNIMSFKVTNFGTNRKPVCDFLLISQYCQPASCTFFKLLQIIGLIVVANKGYIILLNIFIRGESLINS